VGCTLVLGIKVGSAWVRQTEVSCILVLGIKVRSTLVGSA
jgi:hypothetical protein